MVPYRRIYMCMPNLSSIRFILDSALYYQLYRLQSTAPRVLARIARARDMVILEMIPEAMQSGLLEPSVVATVLFTCGHNID